MSETVARFPVGASVLSRIRIGLKALAILKYEPDHPVQGPLFEWCMDSAILRQLAKDFSETPEGRRLLAERPTLQGGDLDLDALSKYPRGTLGHEFAKYFSDNEIHPFATTFPIDSDEAFMAKRYRETHDLLHVITGYATHMLGEIELQAFVWGNLGLNSARMIVAYSVPMRLGICGVKELGLFFKRLRLAYARGQKSRNVMSIEFEKYWDRPVSELAAEWCAPMPAELPVVTEGVYLPPKPAMA